jgi:hypothetical protein
MSKAAPVSQVVPLPAATPVPTAPREALWEPCGSLHVGKMWASHAAPAAAG